jgi:hypothetical protein
MRSYARALSPPTKPNSTPGRPLSGESSKVALTSPSALAAVPVSPSARQNGVS